MISEKPSLKFRMKN